MDIFFPSVMSKRHVFRPSESALASAVDLVLTQSRQDARGRMRPVPSGLFLRFAALAGEQTEFEEFATLYGPLMRDAITGEEPRETLADWQRERLELSVAVEIWKGGIAFGTGDRRRLGEMLDERVRESATLMFVLDDGKVGRPRFGAPLRLDPDDVPTGIVAVPRHLLGMLWMQLADAVERQAEFQQCEICPNWFEVRHDRVGRGTRRYCSGACRIEAHRRGLVRDHQGHRNDGSPEFEREMRRPSVRHPDASGDKA